MPTPDDVSVFQHTGDQAALAEWAASVGWAIVPGAMVNDAVFLHRIGGSEHDYITAAPGQLLAAVGTELMRDTSLVLPAGGHARRGGGLSHAGETGGWVVEWLDSGDLDQPDDEQ